MTGGTRRGGLRSWPMPRLIRFVLLHAAIGWLVAAVFVAALLHSDPGGIGTLLLRAQEGPWPLLLLWFFSGLTFGSAQLGAAVMLLGRDSPPSPPGRTRRRFGALPGGVLQPVPVPRRARRAAPGRF